MKPLPKVIELLRAHYGPPATLPTEEPFELILWENIAYLASPSRRLSAFEKLRTTIGTRPDQILSARNDQLENVTAFGILRKGTAAKLRECARIAEEEFAGDVGTVLREPITTAVKRLQSFPSIGKPGAERVLLFASALPALAPESNGIRVLGRLGLIPHGKSYNKMYEAARGLSPGPRTTPRSFQQAHLLLQVHGRTLCRRKAPQCSACPLMKRCFYAGSHGVLRRSALPARKQGAASAC